MREMQGYSRLVTVFLGTLWSSIKEVKAPFVFDVEHGIGLHAMPVNRASPHSEGEVSWFFLSYDGDGPSKLVSVQRSQDFCLVARNTSRFSSKFGSAIGTPLEMSRVTNGPFPVATVILGFLTIFKNQALSPFEALNSA